MRPILLLFSTLFFFSCGQFGKGADTNVSGLADHNRMDTLSPVTTGQNMRALVAAQPGNDKLLQQGDKILPELSETFTDESLSIIYSTCIGRTLRKGEVAMIIADSIRPMPYMQLTGIQNCLLEGCDGSGITIEYYLWRIYDHEATKLFKKRYDKWLKETGK